MTETDYIKRIVKRLNERKIKHIILISKLRWKEKLEVEIEDLHNEISDLDNKISVLTPK